MNYKHLTIEERCCLREYYKKGYSYRKIAKLMGRNVSTISRELNRNFTHMYDIPTYYPHTAQKKYLLRRSYCHRGMFQDPRKLEYIKEKLLLTWSPEQIANTPLRTKPSVLYSKKAVSSRWESVSAFCRTQSRTSQYIVSDTDIPLQADKQNATRINAINNRFFIWHTPL